MGGMGHSCSLPVIKLRSLRPGPAPTRLPDPLVFGDRCRGVRSVAVQIAHIRSPKPDGPRHDPGFPTDELNREDTLLLPCRLPASA